MSKSHFELQIPTPSPVEVAQKCLPIIDKEDVQRYQDLGLGRGVDVTDPQMWRNKSALLVRKVCPETNNIIGTEEGGVKEKYEKEVSTVGLHQQKIRFSLKDPNSFVKIGIDAQSSQSTSSAKKIAGTKVKTRTIAFQADLDDIPMPYPDTPELETDYQCCKHNENHFEEKLYTWILRRIKSRELSETDQLEEQPSVAMRLLAKLKKMQGADKELKLGEIISDCKELVETLGVTHYISAIKLGAMQYRVFTASIKQTKLGAGAEVGGGTMAVGSLSGLSRKQWFHKFEEEQEIGRIGKDGRVRRGTTDEAVIGCQIQPVYKLVRIQYVQMALQEATEEYIRDRDNTSGEYAGPACMHDYQ